MRNKLLLTIDGIRKDRWGCYNPKNSWITPNITRIAENSIQFEDMMAAATSTGMCFTSIFTGKYQREFGRKTYGDNSNPFPNETVFKDFEDKGYKSIVCLNKRFKIHSDLVNAYSNAEFWWTGHEHDKSEAKDNSSLRPMEQAEYFLDRIQKEDQPTFSWIHLWGFSSPQKKFLDITPFDYDARVIELDEAIGKIFDELNDNHDIAIFADHGYGFLERGRWAYGKDGHALTQSIVSVPFLYHSPEVEAKKIEKLTSQVYIRDFLNNPNSIDSKNDELFYCETRYVDQFDKALSIRKGDNKLNYYYDTDTYEFFDLKSDPHESLNYASMEFHLLERDEKGNHPTLKPFIIRNDLLELKSLIDELLHHASNFYGVRNIGIKEKLKKTRSLIKLKLT